jgi:hypothetical protein
MASMQHQRQRRRSLRQRQGQQAGSQQWQQRQRRRCELRQRELRQLHRSDSAGPAPPRLSQWRGAARLLPPRLPCQPCQPPLQLGFAHCRTSLLLCRLFLSLHLQGRKGLLLVLGKEGAASQRLTLGLPACWAGAGCGLARRLAAFLTWRGAASWPEAPSLTGCKVRWRGGALGGHRDMMGSLCLAWNV